MVSNWMKDKVLGVFEQATILVGGENEDVDIRVQNPEFYTMVFLHGHDGFADAYVKGYWQCDSIDRCVERLVSSGALDDFRFRPANVQLYLSNLLRNKQKPERARDNVRHHYDRGEVFKIMFDPTMSYSCGYWHGVSTLKEAQLAKLDLICRKLYLQPGMSFCDVGCGWGGLIRHAAKKFGCDSLGITLSPDQHSYVEKLCDEFVNVDVDPLAGGLSVQLADYRSFGKKKFDCIASVGMFEHVGHKNYPRFMRCIADHLKDDGLFLLHTIGSSRPSPTLRQPGLPWMERNIFPGAALPSMGQICAAAEGIFDVQDVESFGPYYDKTLMAWAQNFERSWPFIEEKYSEEFRRMWQYYLYACAAMFRTKKLHLWQFVFAKCNNRRTFYHSIRPTSKTRVVESQR